MPRKVYNFIMNYPFVARAIISQIMGRRITGGALSDALSFLKSTLKSAAEGLIKYALENPGELMAFLVMLYGHYIKQEEESFAPITIVEPAEPSESGSGVVARRLSKSKKGEGIGKSLRKLGKTTRKGFKELARHPSENIGKAGEILSAASLIPGPQQPVVGLAALSADVTAKTLKTLGKGKDEPDALTRTKALNPWQEHVRTVIRSGGTMKDAAASWREKKAASWREKKAASWREKKALGMA